MLKNMICYATIKNGKLDINNKLSFGEHPGTYKEGDIIELEVRRPLEKRTDKQNAAIHLYCSQLSKALNEDGFDMRAVISKEVDLFWTPYTVKEFLWKSTQKTLFGKTSTKQLNKIGEIEKIYDVINKVLGERCGIHIPFPSIEQLIDYGFN